MRKHGLLIVSLGVFILAIGTGIAVEAARGPLGRPVESGGAGGDGPFYIGLARSMADGRGYFLDRSPWPTSPHLGRLPLWPWILTAPRWLFPAASDYAILRGTSIFLHGLVALLLVLLTYRLWGELLAAILAGIAFTLYPAGLALMDSGLSEHAFLLATTAGVWLLFGRSWTQTIGSLLLGLSVLARSNAVLLPVLFIAVALIWRPGWIRHWRRAVLLSAIFYLPVGLWILRNYAVSGAIMINAMEGETLYGANNPVVANDLQQWGYWVFPDVIPGEIPKQQLGRRMSEAELNRYYHRKGIEFIRQNWFSLPRLILGKLIRGFVPIPWAPLTSSYVAFLFRWILYGSAIWALRGRIAVNPVFGVFIAALLLDELVTTVLFYGSFRFTFCVEPFLMSCVAVAFAQYIRRVRAGSQSGGEPA
jgi:hypothetical protein